jgi:anti-anti-sigma regulatory factor
MTAGAWYEPMKVEQDGAGAARPAVSIVWPLGREARAPQAHLSLYEGPQGRSGVLKLVGALGRTAFERLELAVSEAVAWGVSRLVLDFSLVTHVDYRRLPEMVAQVQQRLAEGVAFVIVGLDRYLASLFRVAGVDVESGAQSDPRAVCGAVAGPGAVSHRAAPASDAIGARE